MSGLAITAPQSATECDPVSISWTGGTAPYALEILDEDDRERTFQVQSDTTFSWTADLEADDVSELRFRITDSTGASSVSAEVNFLPNANSGCLASMSSASEMSTPSVASATSVGSASGTLTDASSAAGWSPAPTGEPLPSSTPGATSSSSSSGLPGGAIAGIVVGILAALAILGLAYWLGRRRGKCKTRSAWTEEEGLDRDVDGDGSSIRSGPAMDVNPFMGGAAVGVEAGAAMLQAHPQATNTSQPLTDSKRAIVHNPTESQNDEMNFLNPHEAPPAYEPKL